MYLASLINKGHEVYVTGTTDPTALSAELVLRMATIDGAKTVLWDNEIGSLEVGKKVSFTALLLLSCTPSSAEGVYSWRLNCNYIFFAITLSLSVSFFLTFTWEWGHD